MQISISIGYKDIFSDFEQVTIKELISDIPTKNSIEVICYFLAQLHTMERNNSIQFEFLKIWISRLPEELHERLNDFILRTESKKDTNFNFINNISALILIENLIENDNNLERLSNLTPQQELNLFKAYLYCSQVWTDKQHNVLNGSKIKTEKDLIKILLPVQLPYQEILEFKDFRMQFLKAIYFFKFCDSNKLFSEYLDIFLKEYNLKSWQIYLINLLSIYIRKFEPMKTPSIVVVEEKFPEIITFLSDLSISFEDFKITDDFLHLRERPVYKLSNNEFVFLNLNFIVDKLYQGIQFDFAKVLVKNSAKYKNKIIKSPGNFMSIFGDEFSENYLFYNIMDYAFEKSGYIKFRGENMKSFLTDGEPDYYMRDKGKVYVFEFKNIYLGAPVKHSYNYQQIENEIFKKLVQNERKSPKGVTQLVNTIERMTAGDFNKFDNCDFSKVKIYPIIVYVDFSFNLSGINYILNKEFRKIISDKKLKNETNIENLILIDLDSFIKFQDLFRNKTLKLNNCCNEYYKSTRHSKDIFTNIGTFNMFIHNKTRKISYNTPRMLMDEVINIMPPDEDLNIAEIK